jgi:hypothetical protein
VRPSRFEILMSVYVLGDSKTRIQTHMKDDGDHIAHASGKMPAPYSQSRYKPVDLIQVQRPGIESCFYPQLERSLDFFFQRRTHRSYRTGSWNAPAHCTVLAKSVQSFQASSSSSSQGGCRSSNLVSYSSLGPQAPKPTSENHGR